MRYLLLLIIVLATLACNEEKTSLPLSEDKLIPVLIDVHIAEVALQSLRGDTKDSMANLYYEQICTIHGVDQTSIDSTLEILRKDPVRLEKIYKESLDSLDRMSVESQTNDKNEEQK